MTAQVLGDARAYLAQQESGIAYRIPTRPSRDRERISGGDAGEIAVR
ncbi:MAG: hypothetical protein M3446_01500 [Actinomycetota bacterium]|nr:hypothetical protein [Actinomycetota bacterium]